MIENRLKVDAMMEWLAKDPKRRSVLSKVNTNQTINIVVHFWDDKEQRSRQRSTSIEVQNSSISTPVRIYATAFDLIADMAADEGIASPQTVVIHEPEVMASEVRVREKPPVAIDDTHKDEVHGPMPPWKVAQDESSIHESDEMRPVYKDFLGEPSPEDIDVVPSDASSVQDQLKAAIYSTVRSHFGANLIHTELITNLQSLVDKYAYSKVPYVGLETLHDRREEIMAVLSHVDIEKQTVEDIANKLIHTLAGEPAKQYHDRHMEMVLNLASPEFLLPERGQDLIHAVFGIAKEGGELTDAICRCIFYGKPLDYANLREEVGDLMFYVQLLINCIGTTLKQVLADNETKLSERYKEGKFTKEAAQERSDKFNCMNCGAPQTFGIDVTHTQPLCSVCGETARPPVRIRS